MTLLELILDLLDPPEAFLARDARERAPHRRVRVAQAERVEVVLRVEVRERVVYEAVQKLECSV
jgi:hypothetical protein